MNNTDQTSPVELLGNKRRRAIVWTLVVLGAPVSVEVLARFIVAIIESDPTAATERKPVRIERNNLRNRHLKQLSESGVVDIDNELVTPGPRFDAAVKTIAFGGWWAECRT